MTAHAPPRRRWFRYSLRTLFVLVTVLGAFLAWLGVQLKWISDRHDALAAVRESGKYETGREQLLVYSHAPSDPVDAPWSIRILGEPGVVSILFIVARNEASADARRQELERLFPEARVEVVEAVPAIPKAETGPGENPFEDPTPISKYDDSK